MQPLTQAGAHGVRQGNDVGFVVGCVMGRGLRDDGWVLQLDGGGGGGGAVTWGASPITTRGASLAFNKSSGYTSKSSPWRTSEAKVCGQKCFDGNVHRTCLCSFCAASRVCLPGAHPARLASKSMFRPSIPILYPPNITPSSRPGYLTPAISGAHRWAEWLYHPCLLRGLNTGTKNGKRGGQPGENMGKLCQASLAP